MRTIIVLVCAILLSVNAYCQSKLIGAGKATKTGSDTSAETKVTKSPPKGDKKKPINDTVVKKDADDKFASIGYMEITGISFANVDKDGHIVDDYGASLYASEVKFLKPKVFYSGLASVAKEISLDIKIINEDGSINSGTSSPQGYSYSNKLTVQSGPGHDTQLLGWGNNSGGSFSAGQYKFEVWYKGNILFQKGFRLYTGTTPIVNSKVMSITSVSFSNEDNDGNVLSDFGENLYEGEVQYITPKIYYDRQYSNDQKITLYYKYFEPGGNMIVGNSSPVCFSSKQDLVVKSGSNSVKINGWGSASGNTYKAGKHKVEFWVDGEKIYQTTFTVIKKEEQKKGDSGSGTYLTVDSKTALTTTFGSAGGSETFYVKTDADKWITWGIPSFCEITNKTATSFTLKCHANKGSKRTDYMLVKAGEKEVRIDITQN